MDITATSLSVTGLRDWVIQRVSAVVLGVYFLLILGFLIAHPHLDFFTWRAFFAQTWMKVFTILVLLNLIFHSWVGIWTVTTDYIKIFSLRLTVQILMILALLIYLIWGTQILWGL